MSKTGNEVLRRIEAGSVENAMEVTRLRADVDSLTAEVERLEAAIGRAARKLEACGDDLVRFAAGHPAGLAVGRVVLEVLRELGDAGEPEQDAGG